MLRSKRFCRLLCLLLACALLGGCAAAGPAATVSTEPATAPTGAPTEPVPTCPPDGTPGTVTERGSYTGEAAPDTQVALVGDRVLTNEALQLCYGLTIAQWRREAEGPMPDWTAPLDVQLCPQEQQLTWQQFFLLRALTFWHCWQALAIESETAPFPLDPEFDPVEANHESMLIDTMPALEYLYGKSDTYTINRLHREYIESLPQLLEDLGGADALAAGLGADSGEALPELAALMNEAYAYFTYARNLVVLTEEQLDGAEAARTDEGFAVTFRHVLYIPGEEGAETCAANAQWRLTQFLQQKMSDEPRFAVLANSESQDEGSRLNGGLYEDVVPGQLPQELEQWLFAPERVPGDTTVVTSPVGVHILNFSGSETVARIRGREDLMSREAESIIREAMEAAPMEVDFSAVGLQAELPGEDALDLSTLLYPDVAHEHIPDIPLYLQQDFPESQYNNSSLAKTGCGITNLAMLASYMTDTWLTPPVLAARYPKYKSIHGTDAKIFEEVPPELGFFMEKRSFDHREIYKAMEEGKLTMCLQHKGYFTQHGHYLLMPKLNEDGTVSLRDSNLYNYANLLPHRDDRFTWNQITAKAGMFWIWQDKITRIPACHRCGGETGLSAPEGLLLSDYTCGKCLDAIARTDDFLNYFE